MVIWLAGRRYTIMTAGTGARHNVGMIKRGRQPGVDIVTRITRGGRDDVIAGLALGDHPVMAACARTGDNGGMIKRGRQPGTGRVTHVTRCVGYHVIGGLAHSHKTVVTSPT